jgi:hypothetical protein
MDTQALQPRSVPERRFVVTGQSMFHPVAWLAVFAVIAVASVKIAFVDGMKPGPGVAGPLAEVTVPVVQATRATVTNTVQIAARPERIPGISDRDSDAGLAGAVLVGALAGAIPALVAVRVKVIDAIRF